MFLASIGYKYKEYTFFRKRNLLGSTEIFTDGKLSGLEARSPDSWFYAVFINVSLSMLHKEPSIVVTTVRVLKWHKGTVNYKVRKYLMAFQVAAKLPWLLFSNNMWCLLPSLQVWRSKPVALAECMMAKATDWSSTWQVWIPTLLLASWETLVNLFEPCISASSAVWWG